MIWFASKKHALDFGTEDLKQLVESDESSPSVRALLSPLDCPYLITAGTDRYLFSQLTIFLIYLPF